MKSSLMYVFMVLMLETVGLGIITPVLPSLLIEYKLPTHYVAYIISAYSGMMFVSSFFWGYLSDRIGRRPVILLSIGGMAIGYIIFILARSFEMLLLARIISGIFSGSISTATAYIYDISTPQTREKNMSLVSVSFGIGFIIGAGVGGLLAPLSLHTPAILMVVLNLSAIVLLYYKLPESHKPESAKKIAKTNMVDTLSRIFSLKGVLIMVAFIFVFQFGFQGYISLVGVYFTDKFGISATQLGIFLMITGLGIALTQFILLQPALKVFGEKRILQIAPTIYAALVVVMAFLPTFSMVMGLAIVTSMIISLSFAPMNVLSFSLVGKDDKGSMSGINTSIYGLTSCISPLITGFIMDKTVPYYPQLSLLGFFIISAIVISFLKVKKRVGKHVEAESVGGGAVSEASH